MSSTGNNFNYEHFVQINHKRKGYKADENKGWKLLVSKNKVGDSSKYKNIIQLFDSPADLVDICMEELQKNNWQEITNSGHRLKPNVKNEWTYGYEMGTLSKTIECLRDGKIPQPMVDILYKEKEDLKSKFPVLHRLNEVSRSKKRRRLFTEGDGELDIDRYMSNDPAMFSTMTKQLTANRVARVYFDLPTSAGNSFTSFVKNMACCVAIVEIMEGAGTPVELTVGYTVTGCNYAAKYTTAMVIAKRTHEPFDEQKLMTIGLSGFFRYFIFNAWESTDVGKGVDDSLGYATNDLERAGDLKEFVNADILAKASDIAFKTDQAKVLIDGVIRFFKAESEFLTQSELDAAL